MGQQQLLLVILVTIIVGIATVVAINTFGAAGDAAAQDAVRQDLATIAASAQGYYMRPEMLGGGNRSFTGIEMSNISFAGSEADCPDDAAAGAVCNANGEYVLGTIEADNFIVVATVNDADESEIQARVCADDMVMGDLDAGAPANCDGTEPTP